MLPQEGGRGNRRDRVVKTPQQSVTVSVSAHDMFVYVHVSSAPEGQNQAMGTKQVLMTLVTKTNI